MNLVVIQTKYRQIKVENFKVDQANHSYNIITEIYSTQNEEKCVFAETFIRPLLLNQVIKQNNVYHRTIKTKPIDVTSSTVFDIENNNKKDLYLKLVLLSKYQNT